LLLAKPHVELVFRSVLGGLVDNLCGALKLNFKGEVEGHFKSGIGKANAK